MTLSRFLKGEPTKARPWRPWEIIRRKARRHPAALVVVAVMAACALLLLWGGRNYESRIDAARSLSQRKEAEVRRGKPTKIDMSAT